MREAVAMRSRLFTPGPTMLPEQVRAALAGQPPHPRDQGFMDLFRETSERLQTYFRTAHEVLTLTSSGTGAMEAAVVNFLRRGEQIVTIEAGKFGQRWGEIAAAHGVRVAALRVPWGEAVTGGQLAQFLRRHGAAAAVYLTHSETSTGVVHDVAALAAAVRRHSDALIVVDGISSVGVLPFCMDEWGVDVCVSASHKGAMVPPGLAFIAIGGRGWQRAERADLPCYYFDCLKARDGLAAGGTPWTPATTLIRGLHEALSLVLAPGLEARWAEFARQARALRAAVRAIGLEVFAKSPGDSVTAVALPAAIDARALVRHLRERYGIFVAGGQSALKRRIVRIAHMGCNDYLDMVAVVAALELALGDLGWRCEPGRGVAALQATYRQPGPEKE